MNEIKFNVTGNHLEITQDAVTTESCVNYDKCSFTFDSEWDAFTKTAVFAVSDADSYRVLLEDNSCCIPSACLEKDGIIRIGVYGTNSDNTIIATNSVAHHVEEGIDDISDWIEEDYTLVTNAIQKFEEFASDYTKSLDERFDSLLKKVNDAGESLSAKSVNGVSVFPEDKYIPEEYTDAANCPIITNGAKYDDFLNFILNPLLNDFPEYVSRKEIGKDSSGDYSVYSYTFSPALYEKTMVITSNVHGSERMAFLSLCYYLDRLCRCYGNNANLNYIHSKVKLVVVPVVNPYGLANGKSMNSNGVNIGYNFPYKWDENQNSMKGSYASDQTETQNMISLLEEISDDNLCALVDCHTSSFTVSGGACFYTRLHSNCATKLADILNSINPDVDSSEEKAKYVLAASAISSLSNYASDTYGINACELIWANNVYGGIFSNETMTKYTEFIGNVVYTMAKNSSATRIEKASPFAKHITWKKQSDTDVFTIPNDTDLKNMGISSYSLKMKSPAIISLNGTITLIVNNDCSVKINPVLYQINSPELDYSTRVASDAFSNEVTFSKGTHVIPVSSVLQAYYTSYNSSSDCSYCEDVRFVFALSASVENCAQVTAFYVTLNVTPSDIAKPVEICRPMGNVSDYSENDIPTQSVIYPLGNYDNNYDLMFND